jgi:hypothetical protein
MSTIHFEQTTSATPLRAKRRYALSYPTCATIQGGESKRTGLVSRSKPIAASPVRVRLARRLPRRSAEC